MSPYGDRYIDFRLGEVKASLAEEYPRAEVQIVHHPHVGQEGHADNNQEYPDRCEHQPPLYPHAGI